MLKLAAYIVVSAAITGLFVVVWVSFVWNFFRFVVENWNAEVSD